MADTFKKSADGKTLVVSGQKGNYSVEQMKNDREALVNRQNACKARIAEIDAMLAKAKTLEVEGA